MSVSGVYNVAQWSFGMAQWRLLCGSVECMVQLLDLMMWLSGVYYVAQYNLCNRVYVGTCLLIIKIS